MPDYENEDTLGKERHVAKILSERRGWEAHKLSKYDHIDFRMSFGDRTVAFLEVRSRSHTFNTFNPLFIAEDKWKAMLNVGIGFNVPVYFAFYFLDGIYFFDVTTYGCYQTGFAQGRSNREIKRATDYEKVVYVYTDILKKIAIDDKELLK